jgi:hypothetical protein
MGFKLVEIHLPGYNYDKVNILPKEYHGVVNLLTAVGLSLEQSIVVTYSGLHREALTQQANNEGRFNISYTGTYGALPPENLDELLPGSTRQWDLIIAGRFWGACHLSAYDHLLSAIEERRPQHVNFHFIEPLIDGINKNGDGTDTCSDLEEGFGCYVTDAFHVASILRLLQDGVVRHVKIKDDETKYNEIEKTWVKVKSLPKTLTSIDIHFWKSIETFLYGTIKKRNVCH